MDRGVWWATVHEVTKSRTRLSTEQQHGNSSSNFFKKASHCFHSDCTNLHLHQQRTRVLFSPHPLQHLLFLIFLIIVILTDVKRYLIVTWICISLIISDMEHFFMCSLAISILSLKKCYILCPFFLSKLFIFLLLSIWVLCIFWILTSYQIYYLQIISPIQ